MTDTIEEVLTRWSNPEEIRLRAGEIDPETMRIVLEAVNGMARDVRAAWLSEDEGRKESLTEELSSLVSYQLRLRFGNADPETMRTVLAVIGGMSSQIHDAWLAEDNAREDAAIAELEDDLWNSPTGSPEVAECYPDCDDPSCPYTH